MNHFILRFLLFLVIGISIFFLAPIGYTQPSISTSSASTIASQLIQQAYSYERLQRYEEALDAFDKARNLNPNDVAGWLGTSRMLIRLRRFEELKNKWSADLVKTPPTIRNQIQAELGCALWHLGDVVGARSQWEAALLPQSNESAFQTLYYTVIQFGIYEELLRFLIEKRDSNPSFDFLSRLIFDLYVLTMNPEGAVKEAISQVKKNPASESEWSVKLSQFSGDSLSTSTMVQILEGELKKRTNSLREKIGLLWLLGGVKFHSAMFTEAVRDFILADSLGNGKGDRLYEIGDRLLAENQYESAALALEYAKRRSGIEQAYQLFLLGKLAIQQGDTVKAKEFWTRALDHHPNEPFAEDAGIRLAKISLLLQPNEAIRVLRKVNSLYHRTKQMECSVLLIEALYRLGKLKEATDELNLALKKVANDAHLWRGTLIYQNFLIQLLDPQVPDSALFQTITSLSDIPYLDPISTQTLQERILWNSLKESPEVIPKYRAWLRVSTQNPENDSLFLLRTRQLLEQTKTSSPTTQREMVLRVGNELLHKMNRPFMKPLVDTLFATIQEKYFNDARVPTLFLEMAKQFHQRNELAQAINYLEFVIQFSPNSPEGEIARKLLRKWSRDG